jgi:hypothetical protein
VNSPCPLKESNSKMSSASSWSRRSSGQPATRHTPLSCSASTRPGALPHREVCLAKVE